MSSRGVLVCLATLAALCVVMDGPMLARLLPWLTGQCSPALGPVSRWNEWWGIGWLRFHNQLVREVAKADKAQVSGLTGFRATHPSIKHVVMHLLVCHIVK